MSQDVPEAMRAQEPTYYVTVSGRLHLTDPTALAFGMPDGRHPLYAAPQMPAQVQRLTDDEIAVIEDCYSNEFGLEAKHSYDFARAIETACAAAWGVKLEEDAA